MSILNTAFTPSQISEYLENRDRIYFIGIGGVSMSCLAVMTQGLGFSVGGSDRTKTDTTIMLEERNINVNYNETLLKKFKIEFEKYNITEEKIKTDFLAIIHFFASDEEIPFAISKAVTPESNCLIDPSGNLILICDMFFPPFNKKNP